MEKMNTETAAHDLLARMMVTCQQTVTKKFILDNMDKFRSAIIFQSMIGKNIIVGSTNQEMYELYCKVAKEMDIDPISMIDFSRTLCKYYGFELHSTNVGNHTIKRIFRYKGIKTKGKDNVENMQAVAYFVTQVLTRDDVIGQRNTDVYEKYMEWCRENFQPLATKINFSRLVCIILDVQVVDAYKNKQKIRIYAEKDGDDNGDNSPSQKGLG